MQAIRRTAFRTVNTLSIPKSTSIRTPFVLRQNPQPLTAQLFLRFASNDTQSKEESNTPNSADASETSAIKSAIDSVTQSVSETTAGISTYAGQAAESVQENFESAKETVVDNAQALGEAAGYSASSRPARDQNEQRERRPRRDEFQERRPRRDSGDRQERGSGGYVPREREPVTPNPNIYIGNLLFDTPKERLAELFSEFGEVKNAFIATDERGLSKGFGYVEFATVEQATAAIEAKNQEVFDGRRLVVNYQNAPRQRPRPQSDPTKTLFIGNLAFEMSDADLNKLFKDIKNVIDVRVAIDRRTGQPRGFAHAEFTDIESAVTACQQLSGQEVFGRKLRVDYSGGSTRTQEPRERHPGGRNGDRRQGGGRGGDRGDRSDRERY